MVFYKKRFKARSRPRHEPGKMNKTEEKYAWILASEKNAGKIEHWEFEPIKFRLAKRTYYTPDFMVVKNGFIEIHEVKGGGPIEDDSLVKFKTAAEKFWMFKFFMMRFKDNNWSVFLEY